MLDEAKALAPELVRLRRDVHRHPELGFKEFRTAKIVADTLQEIGGIKVRPEVGITGVVGDMGSGSGPTIAIRADMDALPILEKSGADYSSTNEGVMHACGHDAHTAILLGVAHLLKESFARDDLQGNVRFIFQPSEEGQDAAGKSGAMRMVEEGVMEGVDAVIALHVMSDQPAGTVVAHEGWAFAATDTFKAWLTGSGGHGASPHLAGDPLWMLGPVLMALHSIVSRRIDPAFPAVVSLGAIHGGSVDNVIPNEVYLNGTLRSFDDAVRRQLIEEVERAVALSRALGGDYRLEILPGYAACWNDPTVSGWLQQVSRDLLGNEVILEKRPGMGAEDFAYMTQAAPGAMFMLGAAIPDGVTRNHHTDIFDINEEVMPFGAAILAETVRRYLRDELK